MVRAKTCLHFNSTLIGLIKLIVLIRKKISQIIGIYKISVLFGLMCKKSFAFDHYINKTAAIPHIYSKITRKGDVF